MRYSSGQQRTSKVFGWEGTWPWPAAPFGVGGSKRWNHHHCGHTVPIWAAAPGQAFASPKHAISYGEQKGAIILLKQSFAYICICIIKPEAHEVSPSQTPAGLQSPREALHGYHRTRKHKNQPVSVLFLFGVRRQCPLCGRSLLQLQRRLFGIQQTQVDPLSERNYAVCEVFQG